MGRKSQLSWVLVLLVVLISVLVSTSFVSVSAEGVLEESKGAVEEKTEKANEAVKTWKDWALHHSSNAYGSAKQQAGDWSGKGQETAKDYYTKSADSLYTGAGHARNYIGEFITKWRSWAEEKAGTYSTNYKKKVSNPAADAISSLNKGVEDDEL